MDFVFERRAQRGPAGLNPTKESITSGSIQGGSVAATERGGPERFWAWGRWPVAGGGLTSGSIQNMARWYV